MASYLGIFTAYADLPQSFAASDAVGVVAFAINQYFLGLGFSGSSVCQIAQTYPDQSVAQPQIAGFQLCKITIKAILPTTVTPVQAETYIATAIAHYLAVNNFPGNCSATLTGTGPTAIIVGPTPIVDLSGLMMAATTSVTALPPAFRPMLPL
jgi:hypothetical protein